MNFHASLSDVPALLGVETSLTGRRWTGPDAATDRAALALAQQTGQAPIVAAVLARLEVTPGETARFLDPKLRDLMPDPSTLRDMDAAAALFAEIVARKGRIAIFADYDVDGGTSAALLIDWLRQAAGLEATLYVPDRIDEGYGPNVPAMERLAADHDLIIAVDCGTLAHEPIAAAKRSARVIVLDHHQGGETLPPADAVVNPNRQDEETPLTYLAAAGLVFLFLVAVNRRQRAEGRPAPDLLPLLDLVALATIADVAPLEGLNRAFVRQGLKVMATRARPGLRALADVARVDSLPTAYHLGFLLGPRINAGGRIGKADLGARLLATADEHEADALAEMLDRLNRERRDIEAEVLLTALDQAEDRGFDAPLAWASGDGWHPGVVGIVASRLKEKSNRPSIVIGFEGDIGKGSGRSVPGIDLGTAIATATREGLLTKGGGHKMAAGLTVSRDLLAPAMARIGELLDRQGAGAMGPPGLKIDGTIGPAGATLDLLEALDLAGPFGASARAPRVALPAIRIAYTKRVGTGHLALTLKDPGTGATLDAIAFGAAESGLGPALEAHGGAAFHVAGRLERNDRMGRRSVKLHLEDAAPA